MAAYQYVQFQEKMRSPDADIRYMAVNDLHDKLSSQIHPLDEGSSTKLVDAFIKLLGDTNGDVQNMTVKCLAPFVRCCRDNHTQDLINRLCEGARKKSDVADISATALRTVIVEISASSSTAPTITKQLLPRLMEQLNQVSETSDVQVDSVDVLIELINKFGQFITDHAKVQKVLLQLLTSSRAAVRKRAVIALAALSRISLESLVSALMSHIIEGFRVQKSDEGRLTLLNLTNQVARTDRRIAGYIKLIYPPIRDSLKIDNNEIREAGLVSLETFIIQCSGDMAQYLEEAIEIGNEYIKHDPNYAGGDDDEDMEDTEEVDEDFDEDDFTDNEDISWKVRRASAKLLASIISTYPTHLSQFYNFIAPVLISRFSDREETVRIEVLKAFTILLEQTSEIDGQRSKKRRRESGESIGSKSLLREHASKLSTSIKRQAASPSANTQIAAFILLRQLCITLYGGLYDIMAGLVKPISSILTSMSGGSSSSSSTLKIAVLEFVDEVAAHPTLINLQPYLDILSNAVTASINDKFYKIAAQAVDTLVPLIKPSNASTLIPIILEKVENPSTEAEVRERGICALAEILPIAEDSLALRILGILLDRLRNETTRIIAIKCIETSASSVPQFPAEWVSQVVEEFTSYLRKQNRALKTSTLSALAALLAKNPISQETETIIATSLRSALDTEDLAIVTPALTILTRLSPESAHAIDSVINLISLPVVQGNRPTVDAILEYLAAVSKTDNAEGLVTTLRNRAVVGAEQGIVAEAIATLLCHGQDSKFSEFIELVKKPKSSERERSLGLLVVGHVGKKQDLSSINGLQNTITGQFLNPSDTVKSAAAFALGAVTSGNVSFFLPGVMSKIYTEPTQRSSLVHALKEVIASDNSGIKAFAMEMWKIFFDTQTVTDDGSKLAAAECIGRLALLDSQVFLPELKKYIRSNNTSTRVIVIAAIRYTLIHASPAANEGLRFLLDDFHVLLQDRDIEIRRSALATLKSIVHNKLCVILPQMDTILPILFHETGIKKELVKVVVMGPFKHTVDDGLELRKTAYETLYELLDTPLAGQNINMFLDRVVAGLSDEQDIKILCNLMLIKITEINKADTQKRLDEVSNKYTTVLSLKLKESALKQEIEKNMELRRSVLRTSLVLEGLAVPVLTPKFSEYLRNMKQLYSVEIRDMEKIEGEIDAMDTT
ncbi:Cullin-associated NEDD8-dissociated protein 1 [Neolecta irregularis DAH-3]|uniref:Cullin-associated NEDD8-dissociated protein 1 n=1 Tax=Neolecta irregularis (strain DAH-3) TaxID=1198029 RepID=A0A1U7LPI2_NEOID|nr:Cullin-associated NEDD8-dissociated protein 1 [Neolecta irregularis DAH-3]|eukprot:OLL24576.1 Cullin-associated NEDD8-dissociated protein 1 [Neolecta irregularis DAH-3]